MRTRKMWAPRGWLHPEAFSVFKHGRGDVNLVDVLVTDASDMPDFEPGDRVKHEVGCVTGEVVAYPVWNEKHQKWCVLVLAPAHGVEVWHANLLTKLPHEKTVTLRVTGPEDRAERAIKAFASTFESVRVERVEDPDE